VGRKLPVRVRLAFAFAVAMVVVLGVGGAVLYLRLGSTLGEAIVNGLEARLADVAAAAGGAEDVATSSLLDPEDSFTQILDISGRVLSSTVPGGEAVLTAGESASVGNAGPLQFERAAVPGVDGGVRILAAAIETDQGLRIAVVGASLQDRAEALAGLRNQLVIVGPIALLVATLLGYAVAVAALRPVESMRAEAAAVSASEPGRRLPVPPARDELSRLATTLNDMLARLETAIQRERSFVADASHELRTPLSLLKTELELALRRPRPVEELEQALRSAAAETDRLAQLAEDLLVLARSDEGRLELRRSDVGARELAERVATRFAVPTRAAGRELRIEAPEALRLDVDELRLEQALGNLVANAFQHGGGTVHLRVEERNGRAELHVLDEGAGFAEAFLGRAFERFSRSDEARTGDGAGLGLAIARVIAVAHGGAAHAANRDGGGADVWLELPA
jgi:heavy metal sensor kinase